MEIKIYAPVDCEVRPITSCQDKIFAQKMMGDGLMLLPKSNNFKSFLEKSTVALIFDTKHAYFFEHQKVKTLLHIGMDTVTLNGEPFQVLVKEKQQVNLQSDIVTVEFDKIKEKQLSEQTIICFDQENIQSIAVKILKSSAKQGELIATVDVNLKQTNLNALEIKDYESKYLLTGKSLVEAVGGLNNFSKVYNCMTRVRFLINDVDKINYEKIKKLELVKGINLNGQELQVIIGGECYKVKDEIVKIQSGEYEKKTQNRNEIKKPPVYRRMMQTISGIMMPQIPALMAVGIFGAIYAILMQLNVIEDFEKATNPKVMTTLFYVLSKVGLNLIGVLFAYSTAVYFKGNPILAILVGLTLSSRIFLSGVATPVANPGFGDYLVDGSKGISGWLLFKINSFPIVVTAYEGSVLPYIFSAAIVILADKWIKKWMPTSIDIIFRPFLVYSLAVLQTLFVFGPLLGLVEMGFSQVALLLEKDVTGIGVATFALSWQILVLTGVHVAVVMTIMIGTVLQNPVIPTTLLSALIVATFAQMGGAIAVAVRTKNSQLKGIAYGALPAAFFGITEPIIYAVNLPKIRPFLCSCAGAFIGGLFIKWFDLAAVRSAGMGVFGVIWVDGIKNQMLFVLTWIIAIGAAFGLTMLSYSEKADEYNASKKLVNKINQKMLKVLVANGQTKTDAQVILTNLTTNYLTEIKDNKKLFKDYLKYLSQKSKLEQKLICVKGKDEKIKKHLFDKAVRAKNKLDQLGEGNVIEIIAAYNNFAPNALVGELTEQLNNLVKENERLEQDYHNFVNKLTQASEKMLEQYQNISQWPAVKNYEAGFVNALNACEINYGIVDYVQISFSKSEKKQLKNCQKISK